MVDSVGKRCEVLIDGSDLFQRGKRLTIVRRNTRV